MSRSTLAEQLFGTKKKRINSKKKGDANERSLAKVLTRWCGYEFVRIPQSGGLRWRESQNICGDLICTDFLEFPFNIETKHLKSLSYSLNLRNNSRIFTIWKQALADHQRNGKVPVMMLRANGWKRGEWLFVISQEFMEPLEIEPLCQGQDLIGYSLKETLKTYTLEQLTEKIKDANTKESAVADGL